MHSQDICILNVLLLFWFLILEKKPTRQQNPNGSTVQKQGDTKQHSGIASIICGTTH